MALGEERQRNCQLTGFGTFDLDQGGAKRVQPASFATPKTVGEIGHALLTFFVAGITAEKEIIQIQAIEHDL
jgi:hypothetical protein